VPLDRFLSYNFSVGKLKETILKELGISSFMLIEQRSGIDVSSAHPDEEICTEKRKQIVSNQAKALC